MMRWDLDLVSACASVLATTKSTPCRPAAIMLLTALPPAPPTPNTVMRAFISQISVMLLMFYLQALRSASTMVAVVVWSSTTSGDRRARAQSLPGDPPPLLGAGV